MRSETAGDLFTNSDENRRSLAKRLGFRKKLLIPSPRSGCYYDPVFRARMKPTRGRGREQLAWTLAIGLALGLGSPPAFAQATAVPAPVPAAAPPAVAAATWSSPTDEPAHSVRRHYLWSNERRHDLFFSSLLDIGGGYLGVGGDQNYTLAAAANSEVLWLIDLDSAVVHMHRLYAALLPGAATAQAFLALFEPRAAAAVHETVTAHYTDAAERRAVLETYHAYRELLRDHLRETVGASHGHTWLGDPAYYERIRSLAARGRLVARLGDLTGSRTMLEVAEAAKRSGIQVRVVYLSNAESWFPYGPAFRHNFMAMPFDDKSVVLRTIKSQLLRYPSGDIWHYSIQRARHFAENLGRPAYRSIDVAMTDAVLLPTHGPGVSYLGFPSERNEKRLLPVKPKRGEPKTTRSTLVAAGLVTRPAGNRERASEMDRALKKRAALELARANLQ